MAANPTSESELHLYRVLQRSNLLQYFETFISQGGDDVQQLCEAGEEEFLEIMALVGMASKPLHVRRLQKALQEWVTNPAVFHQPLGPHTPPPPVAPGSILASVQRPYLKMNQSSTPLPLSNAGMANWSPPETSGDLLGSAQMALPVRSFSPASVTGTEGGVYSDSNGMMGGLGQPLTYSVDSPEYGGTNSVADDRSTVSPGLTAQLTEGQVAAIEKAAEELAKTLPHYEPKSLNAKKLINKEIEEVMKLPNDHPERMDLLRKYGCIYGRFDSRRKNEKHLSLHEISVNEASAQLCRHRVTLLTRRDDLFPLARQVVRDSGYQYSKGHSRGQNVEIPPNKKQRFENFMYPKPDGFLGNPRHMYRSPRKGKMSSERPSEDRPERMTEINRELTNITAHQQVLKHQIQQTSSVSGGDPEEVTPAHAELEKLRERQLLLLTEQSDLLRKQRSLKRSHLQSVDKSLKDEGQEDYDEDSMPFPSETFPQSATEEEFFDVSSSGPSKSSKEYIQQSLYQEGLRMIQQYTGSMASQNFPPELPLHDGQLAIKQELGGQDVTSETSDSGGSPELVSRQGTSHGMWPSRPSATGSHGNRGMDHAGMNARVDSSRADDATDYIHQESVSAADKSGFGNANGGKAGDNRGKKDNDQGEGSYGSSRKLTSADSTVKQSGQS